MLTSKGRDTGGKTPLSGKDLERFREILVRQRGEILKEIGSLREALRLAYAEKQDPGSLDFAENAADSEGAEQAAFQIRRLTEDFEQMTSALRRIEQGTFGKCVRCGDFIEKERLEALPATRRCTRCKSAAEVS